MIYLNNAATSYPKPDYVSEAVCAYIKNIPFHSLRTGLETKNVNNIDLAREKLAQLFNIQNPDCIVFTSGATSALNLAIMGLEPEKQDHFITTSTEHNSVIRPLKTLQYDKGIQLTIVDCDKNGIIDPQNIEQAIQSNTKAIIVNHASNVVGTVIDIDNISRIARKNGVMLVVDGAQSAGAIPIDLSKMQADIFIFAGHKSLFGLPGIGGLYINETIRLKPIIVGGTGVRSDLLTQPQTIPMYYEAGTPNMPGIISLKHGADFILETGMDSIMNKKNRLIDMIYHSLCKIDRVILYGERKKKQTAVVSFNIRGVKPDEVTYILENSFQIITRSGLHCAPLIHKALGSYPDGSVRISPSYFSEESEIQAAIDAIKSIASAI